MPYDSDTEQFIDDLHGDPKGGRWPWMIPTYDWYSEHGAFFLLTLVAMGVGWLVFRGNTTAIAVVVGSVAAVSVGTFSTLAWYYTVRLLRRRFAEGLRYTWGFELSRPGGWFNIFGVPIMFLGICGGLAAIAFIMKRQPAFTVVVLIAVFVALMAFSLAGITAALRPPSVLFLSASSQRALIAKQALIFAAQPLRVVSFVRLPNTNIEYFLSSVSLNVFRKDDDVGWLKSVERVIGIVSIVVIDCQFTTEPLVQEIVAITKKDAIEKSLLVGNEDSRRRLVSLLPSSIQRLWQHKELLSEEESLFAVRQHTRSA